MNNRIAEPGIVLVTGALGAGKTTVIEQLVRGDPKGGAVVLKVGDGPFSLNGLMPAGWRQRSIPVNAGTTCTEVADSLCTAVTRLVKDRGALCPVVIETSGLTDVQPVVHRLRRSMAARDFPIHGVVTVVDARRSRLPAGCAEVQRRQVLAADLVVLNKLDCVPPADADDVRQWIRRMAPGTACVSATHGVFCGSAVRALQSNHRALAPWPPARPDAPVDVVCLRSDQHIDPFAFNAWLTTLFADYGPNLLRVKGVVALWGQPAPVSVQVVGRAVDILPLHAANGEQAHSELLVIGRNLDAEHVQGRFWAGLRDAWEGTHHGTGACSHHQHSAGCGHSRPAPVDAEPVRSALEGLT